MTASRTLVRLLAEKSTKRGRFTLASGQESDFYIDARLTSMSPDGLSTIGLVGLEQIHNAGWRPDAVGGLTLGADPIAYAISYASSSTDHPLRAFTVRKQAKAHGTQKLIEGPMFEGDRVVVVEDVITTGGSALQAIRAIRDAGADVIGVLGLVDREQGGKAAIEDLGISVIALATATAILEYFDQHLHSQSSSSNRHSGGSDQHLHG